jgi:hypothetical protein
MLESNMIRKQSSGRVRLSVVAIAIMVLFVGTAAAQDSPVATPQSALGTAVIPLGGFGGGWSLPTTASAESRQWQWSDTLVGEFAGSVASMERNPVHPGVQRITLEQVKQQQFVASNPLAHLAHLSIEAAKQHRLGAQADYFPKISSTVANLHYSELLGQVLTLRRPIAGSTVQVPVPLLAQKSNRRCRDVRSADHADLSGLSAC